MANVNIGCYNCKAQDLKESYSFCPYCGTNIKKSHSFTFCIDKDEFDQLNELLCYRCMNILMTNFFIGGVAKEVKLRPKTKRILKIEPLPKEGITIEFNYSNAQSFNSVIKEAKKFNSFKKFGEDKNCVYRVNFYTNDIEKSIALYELIKSYKRKKIYFNGEQISWTIYDRFLWCYRLRKASYRPDLYCFGFESGVLNIWGCRLSTMHWTEYSEWFTWGRWLNKKGDWEFDKERIRRSLQDKLYPIRFCPALKLELVEKVIEAIPKIVNPYYDKDWKFRLSFYRNEDGLEIEEEDIIGRKNIAICAIPNGKGALYKIIDKIKTLALPNIDDNLFLLINNDSV